MFSLKRRNMTFPFLLFILMITTKEQLNDYIAKDLKHNGLNGGVKQG